MNWQQVIEELQRQATYQREIVTNPYQHTAVKQAASTVCAILDGIAEALKKGLQT